MPASIPCPSCKVSLKTPDNLLGKTIRCPKCSRPVKLAVGNGLVGPAQTSPAAPKPPAPPAAVKKPVASAPAPTKPSPAKTPPPEEPVEDLDALDELEADTAADEA